MKLSANPLSQLHWELSCLARAIAYQNLSEAAMHIGLSQPQLSRIVLKIEAELKIVLLDRTAKRKSGWTSMAMRISESFIKSERRLECDLQEMIEGAVLQQIRIGTLEGVSPLAMQASHHLLTGSTLHILELDIYDLDELEKMFLKNDLDLIFTFREPAKRKYRYIKKLGVQHMDWLETGNRVFVQSTFEYHSQIYRKRTNDFSPAIEKNFISNSLWLRRQWFKLYGGIGMMPSEKLNSTVKGGVINGDESVFLIGSEQLSPAIWESVQKLEFNLK